MSISGVDPNVCGTCQQVHKPRVCDKCDDHHQPGPLDFCCNEWCWARGKNICLRHGHRCMPACEKCPGGIAVDTVGCQGEACTSRGPLVCRQHGRIADVHRCTR